jgi:hypothetical protein
VADQLVGVIIGGTIAIVAAIIGAVANGFVQGILASRARTAADERARVDRLREWRLDELDNSYRGLSDLAEYQRALAAPEGADVVARLRQKIESTATGAKNASLLGPPAIELTVLINGLLGRPGQGLTVRDLTPFGAAEARLAAIYSRQRERILRDETPMGPEELQALDNRFKATTSVEEPASDRP